MKHFIKTLWAAVTVLLLVLVGFTAFGGTNVRADDMTGHQDAKELTLGQWTYSDVAQYRDTTDRKNNVWYKITVPSDGFLTILSNTTSEGKIELYDADLADSYLDSSSFTYVGLGGDESSDIRETTVDSGTYFLRYFGFEKAGRIGTKVTLESGKNNEGHDNRSFDTAKEIKIGDSVNGFISQKNRSDYYKFNVPKAEKVNVNLTTEFASYIYLYDSDRIDQTKKYGEENFVRGKKDNSETKKFTLNLSAGTYYLKLVDDGWVFGRYSLKLSSGAAAVTMHRVYNPKSGEHFYTSDAKEFNHLVLLGWHDEGIGWIAPSESSTPVYRLYNKNGGEHHYTTKKSERDSLISRGWKDEGIGWYSDDQKGTPLYRLYNSHAFANNHHYTTSVSEKKHLISIGWKDEGVAWYGVSTN